MIATAASTAGGANPGDLVLVLALMWPVVIAMVAMALGGRHAARVAALGLAVLVAITIAIAYEVLLLGRVLEYRLGGWSPPLGLRLRADGLSAAMMLTSALVLAATALYARDDFATPAGATESRAAYAFWVLLIALGAALNSVFLGHDLFNLYVAIELLTFAAVPLVCLDGRGETLAAALRYLLFALLGSILYLLGCALIYGACGTLDLTLVRECATPGPAAWTAGALMTVGLLAKTAIVPLHLWLPPAHAGAPPAASTVLSALVVKGSFFILLRVWFEALPSIPTAAALQLLGALGAAAIVLGSVLALRQARLKLMVAYSTVAQLGYLMLLFPLAWDGSNGRLRAGLALTGGLLQAVAHAFAKAAMFMSAGLAAKSLGHDRVDGLAGLTRRQPLTMLAFALAGVSLIGLPPSGGFAAKWLLLSSALAAGQWWWAVVIVLGGLLTGTYVFVVLKLASGEAGAPAPPVAASIPRHRECVALVLAAIAVALGALLFAPLRLPEFAR